MWWGFLALGAPSQTRLARQQGRAPADGLRFGSSGPHSSRLLKVFLTTRASSCAAQSHRARSPPPSGRGAAPEPRATNDKRHRIGSAVALGTETRRFAERRRRNVICDVQYNASRNHCKALWERFAAAAELQLRSPATEHAQFALRNFAEFARAFVPEHADKLIADYARRIDAAGV
jgi:hypothetical protein